eukprot:895128-Prymnesium_polylepis.2
MALLRGGVQQAERRLKVAGKRTGRHAVALECRSHPSGRAQGVEVSWVQRHLQPAFDARRRVLQVVWHDAKER